MDRPGSVRSGDESILVLRGPGRHELSCQDSRAHQVTGLTRLSCPPGYQLYADQVTPARQMRGRQVT